MAGKNTRLGRETVLAMAGLALVLFLVALDGTVVGTAMPRIIAELNGFELYAWVTTAFLLAQTAVIPIVGKLGDLYGRKWLAVAGVAVFVGASALCGLAPSMIWLIIFRGLQGLGGGMLFSTVFGLIADIFPDLRTRARYQGTLFTAFSLSSVIGPVLGGWITDALSWRWVFYINLPPGILALVVLPLVLPQGERRQDARIDYWGALLSTVGIVSLLMSLEFANLGGGFGSPQVIAGLLVAVVAFAIFVPVELRAKEPIISLQLFRNPTFTSNSLVAFLVGVVLLGVSLYAPLFAQAVLGMSASASGFVMMPMVVTLSVVGLIVGPMIARYGRIKPFILAGCAGMSVAGVLLVTLDGGSSAIIVGIYLFIMALGLGFVLPTTPLAVQSSVDRSVIGVATAAMQFLQSIGMTVGAALIGTVVTGGYTSGLAANAPSGVPEAALTSLKNPNALIDPHALDQLGSAMQGVQNSAVLTQQLLEVARVALMDGIRSGFFIALAASLLALGCAFFMANIRLGDNAAIESGAEHEELGMTRSLGHGI